MAYIERLNIGLACAFGQQGCAVACGMCRHSVWAEMGIWLLSTRAVEVEDLSDIVVEQTRPAWLEAGSNTEDVE